MKFNHLCFIYVFLIVFSFSTDLPALSNRNDRGRSSYFDLFRGNRNYALDQAEAFKTLLKVRKDLVRQLGECGDNAEEKAAIVNQIRRIDEMLKPLGFKDAALRVAIGRDTWEVIKELDTSDLGAFKMVGYAAGLKGIKVLGERLEEAVNKSFGEFLSDILYGSVSGVKKTGRYLIDRATFRDGSAFDQNEVVAWQRTLNKTFSGLIYRARKSSMVGQRDRIARSIDDEDELAVDDSWKWQRDIYEKEFRAIADRIESCLKYYRTSNDREAQIIKYSSLIRDWLIGFVDNCLLKTNSYKDLGFGSNIVALNNIKDELDNYFGILLKYVAPKLTVHQAEPNRNSMMRRRYLDDDEDEDLD